MDYNWKQKREKRAFLALADGTVFHGWSFGADADALGEVVFNTGMSGYQEILTDPSYSGQFVVLTVPEVGNYGCNPEDVESAKVQLNGLIINELNPASNYRATESLQDCLRRYGKVAIAGIDTRALTLLLRTKGNQKAFLHCDGTELPESEAVKRAQDWCGLDGQDYAAKVTCEAPYVFCAEGDRKVVAYDFGVKTNILRHLAKEGFQVTVVPAKTPAEDVLAMNPDGVFLSNGPADPAAVTYAQENIRRLLGKVPLMGICLGHQLLGIACGGVTGRLKFGHHGCNHPVKNLADGSVEITSQNHNFALLSDRIPDCLEVTHINLNDNTIEGVRHKTLPAFSVQYHPESAPGPHDSAYLFQQFRKLMESR